MYPLVQTVLVQDEALKAANAHIEALEGGATGSGRPGGFLDNMREALFEILESAGYAVTTACDGVTALSQATDKPPQLVITDLVMPDKTGVEFIRSIRRSGGTLAKVPILVLSWT